MGAKQGRAMRTVVCRGTLLVWLCISVYGIHLDRVDGSFRPLRMDGALRELVLLRRGRDLRKNPESKPSELAWEGSAHGLSLVRNSMRHLRLRGGSQPEPQAIDWGDMGSEDIAALLQEMQLNEKKATHSRFAELLAACAHMTDKGDLGGVQRGIEVLERASHCGVKFASSENGAYEASRSILDVAQREGLLKECAKLLALMEAVELEMPLSSHHSVVDAVRARLENSPRFSSNDLKRLSKIDGLYTQASNLNYTEPVIELPEHPKLVRGTLTNGLRYAILPNRLPPNRMCATLQVHVGSLEEEDEEQGIAHYLEHMLFAGTQRYPSREAMRSVLSRLGMSSTADQNAQTSFRSTCYTASCPSSQTSSKEEEERKEEKEERGGEGMEKGGEREDDNVWTVIDLFHQMAFNALLEDEAIDAERGVILSELQDRNTVGFRQTKAFYEQLYNETDIPKRYPRGKEEQIAVWNSSHFRSFYDRFYCASNMDLFVVGDIDPSHVLECIMRTFGREPAAPRACPDRLLGPLIWSTDGDINWVMPPLDVGPLCAWTSRGVEVEHCFGEAASERFKVMRHELVPEVRISWFEKEPLAARQSEAAMQAYIVDCLIGAALGQRKSALLQGLGDPPFTGMGWSKGGRSNEDCAINSFFVSAQPHRWKEAVVLAVREVLKLTRFGLDKDELESVKASVLAGYKQRAERVDTIASSLYMAKMTTCVESCMAFMDGVQEHALAAEMIKNITLEDVNDKAAELLSIVTHYPNESTSSCFVTCPQQGVPDLTAEQVLEEVRKAGQDLERPVVAVLPPCLIPAQEMEELVRAKQPAWHKWRRDGSAWQEGDFPESLDAPATKHAHAADSGAGAELSSEDSPAHFGNESVLELQLSNGVKLNVMQTKLQPKQCIARVTALGSEAVESQGGGAAAVQVGVSSWVHGGCGGHSAEVISRFCTRWNIHTEACYGAEGIALKVAFTTGEGDADCMLKALQLLHLLLRKPDFAEVAFERTIKRVEIAHGRMCKSLQASTRQRFEELLTETPDLRLVQLAPRDVEGCTLEQAKRNVEGLLGAERLEVCLVGDFDLEQFKHLAKVYFGTLSASGGSESAANDWPARVQFRNSSARANVTVVDDVEQCSVIMGFPTVNAWGLAARDAPPASQTPQAGSSKGGLHLKLCLHLAARIISNRLFEQVREKRGLVYSISFRWQAFQILQGGIALIQYMPKTGTAAETEQATKQVLAELLSAGFSEGEFIKVQRPVVARSRDARSSNGWWLDSLQFLQLGNTPCTAKDIMDVPDQVERITKEEVFAAMQTHWKEGLSRLVMVCGSTTA